MLREATATGESYVATHLPFPSVGRVAMQSGAFRWVPVFWDIWLIGKGCGRGAGSRLV